jgi:hypothetical protein
MPGCHGTTADGDRDPVVFPSPQPALNVLMLRIAFLWRWILSDRYRHSPHWGLHQEGIPILPAALSVLWVSAAAFKALSGQSRATGNKTIRGRSIYGFRLSLIDSLEQRVLESHRVSGSLSQRLMEMV